ncbi:hypothetical protein ANCCAN_10314 [Ancylostoma caninum]|uniref:Uncharacterized protein n=1 Tax=Ancylostoma caninum TaxID=29170 RepID=A0A368GH12_ANCCA|nr:hypothetical protein ANCCAN_10314 [Ancylostoma caninum]
MKLLLIALLILVIDAHIADNVLPAVDNNTTTGKWKPTIRRSINRKEYKIAPAVAAGEFVLFAEVIRTHSRCRLKLLTIGIIEPRQRPRPRVSQKRSCTGRSDGSGMCIELLLWIVSTF